MRGGEAWTREREVEVAGRRQTLYILLRSIQSDFLIVGMREIKMEGKGPNFGLSRAQESTGLPSVELARDSEKKFKGRN